MKIQSCMRWKHLRDVETRTALALTRDKAGQLFVDSVTVYTTTSRSPHNTLKFRS